MGDLNISQTPIPGLLIIKLPLSRDPRGWFKENWQQEKLGDLGLRNFFPVQNNISFNGDLGTTRGIHAEPWDKYISVANGRIFGAWVDLRSGPEFGTVFTHEVGPDTAVFVPRGVGNAFQCLEPNTTYTYLVNDHWSPESTYSMVNLADKDLAISWPISIDSAIISEKDKFHPEFHQVSPLRPRPILVLGADGQLGKALRAALDSMGLPAEFFSRQDLDISDGPSLESSNFKKYSAVINAAAYTSVDLAETEQGKAISWRVNAKSVSSLSRACEKAKVPLVQISSDYVFDGNKKSSYREDDEVSPLGVYGQTKAAGDMAVLTSSLNYVVRTSWVVGDGSNFVKTMAEFAIQRKPVKVVCDQIGRLTFSDELADGILQLLVKSAPTGIYNFSNQGNPMSWYEIAQEIYSFYSADLSLVQPVSSDEYSSGTNNAPRPKNSSLNLDKLLGIGISPRPQLNSLHAYLKKLDLQSKTS